jgi:hypothetical protein
MMEAKEESNPVETLTLPAGKLPQKPRHPER